MKIFNQQNSPKKQSTVHLAFHFFVNLATAEDGNTTMQQGMTQFLITGDSSRNKLQTMPGGGYSTIKIELPRNWDALMKTLEYRPLNDFYLY